MGDQQSASIGPPERMQRFIRSGEAEEYALKVRLDTGGIFTNTYEESAQRLRERVGEPYELLRRLNDNQRIMTDVADLNDVYRLATAQVLNWYKRW